MSVQPPVRSRDPGRLLRRLDTGRDRRAAGRGVEAGQRVGAIAEHGDAERLEQLRSGGHVEQRLRARAHDEGLGPAELAEIGGDVEPLAAVDTADAPGGQEADPGRAADGQRASDRRRADRRLGHAGGQVPRAHLARVDREALELGFPEPDAHLAVEDADGCGQRPSLTYSSLALECDRNPFSRREPVCDERRLEGDDGPAAPDRLLDLARETDHGIAPSLATHRAAASAASSGPPTRNPAASASPAPVVSTTSTAVAGTSRPSTVKPAAPRFTTTLRAGGSAPRAAISLSFPKTMSGWSNSSRLHERIAHGLDPGRAREVDAEPAAERLHRAGRLRGCLGDRVAEERVAGEVEHVAAAEPGHLELLGAQLRRDPAVGEHRPPALAVDQRDDDAVSPLDDRPDDVDAPSCELGRHDPTRGVGRPLADEAPVGAELDRPGSDVRRLPAGPGPRLGGALRVRLDGALRQDDHVEEQVAEGANQHSYNAPMDGNERRAERLRSFVFGGLIGASAVIAAARRMRRREAPRQPAGLAAFEDAPCYQETIERDAVTARGQAERAPDQR